MRYVRDWNHARDQRMVDNHQSVPLTVSLHQLFIDGLKSVLRWPGRATKAQAYAPVCGKSKLGQLHADVRNAVDEIERRRQLVHID